MPFDGSAWNQAIPTNSDLANEIDDFMRDDKVAVQGRMALEHVWPTSQVATSEAGYHKFITFQGQTSAPPLTYGATATQLGVVWVSSGTKNLLFTDSAGTNYLIAKSGAGISFFGGTGTIGSLPYITSGGGFAELSAPSATNSILAGNGVTTAPSFKAVSTIVVISAGSTANGATIGLPSGVNSNEVQGIMISIADATSAIGTSCPDGVATVCAVSATRVVTSKWISINNSAVSGNANANYVVIGMVTH